jgi:hypothetical protein
VGILRGHFGYSNRCACLCVLALGAFMVLAPRRFGLICNSSCYLVDPPYRNRIDLLTVLEARSVVTEGLSNFTSGLMGLTFESVTPAKWFVIACVDWTALATDLPPVAFWLAVVLKLKGLRRVSRKLQGHGAERAAVTLQGLLDEAFDIQVKALRGGCHRPDRIDHALCRVNRRGDEWGGRAGVAKMAKRTNNSNEQKKSSPRSS